MGFSNLVVDAFMILRDTFFNEQMEPQPFTLRDKRNTQDDPLDEYISNVLRQRLDNAVCKKSPGPLINPDLIIYRPELCNGQPKALLNNNPTKIVGIEVKKLQRNKSGRIARASGLDYNTTPPCGTILAYTTTDLELHIKGFYLFLAQESVGEKQYIISALALCDGNFLNEDFNLYQNIVGQRKKEINLGTYGDGADRKRPMLIFANPLAISELDQAATIVMPQVKDKRLETMYKIVRSTVSRETKSFFAYHKSSDVPVNWKVQTLHDPFPHPTERSLQTQPRGRFRLPIEVK